MRSHCSDLDTLYDVLFQHLTTPVGDRSHILALRSLWPTLLDKARNEAAVHPLQHAPYQIVSATVYETRIRTYQDHLDEMFAVMSDALGEMTFEVILAK